MGLCAQVLLALPATPGYCACAGCVVRKLEIKHVSASAIWLVIRGAAGKKKVIGAHLLPENRKLLLPKMHDEWNGEQDFKTNKFKFQAANCNKGNWTARKNKKSEICTCTERKSMAIT